jgi:hypothetical protein
MKILHKLIASGLLFFIPVIGHQPNPPIWPPSSVDYGGVFVFDPEDPSAQKTINDIYTINGGINQNDNGQFSANRYALLFKPGNYSNLSVPVGYYTSVIGLGKHPKDTKIFEVVCYEGNYNQSTGALNTFWRSAENFTMAPTKSYWMDGPICMLWAASQACPLRRIQLTGSNGNLSLYQYAPPFPGAGYSSGGYIANSNISGIIDAGSQQQYFTRNTRMGGWINGIWNFVFVGCIGAPASSCGAITPLTPYTNVAETPIIAEKPYMIIDAEGLYSLVIPGMEFNKVGPSFSHKGHHGTKIIDFKHVYIASPADTAAKINEMIKEGHQIILTPGLYYLDESINVDRDDLCILGIGYPTLIPTSGNSCIKVGSTKGVRIGGILFQAGFKPSKTLLVWGEKGSSSSSSDLNDNGFNYGFLYDTFVRVGGPTNSRICPVATDVMVEINSDHVVSDNSWLWRADHDVGGIVVDGNNPCNTALIVNGDHVTMYGTAAEHTLKDILQWNGNKGRLYFYQSEYPYDVTEKYGEKGYVAYRVDNQVKSHQAWGVAVYSFFRDYHVVVKSGIKTPKGGGIHFVNSLTRWLNGNGGIQHVINSTGPAVNASSPGPAYLCEF